MKTLIQVSTCLLFSYLLISCGDTTTPSDEMEAEEVPSEIVEDGLHLNEGNKWQVPEDMMWQVQSQKDKLFEYQMAGDTTYIKLAHDLDSLCKNLVNICTMDGEAHNVLHEWLIPHWELIDQIGAASSLEEAQAHVDKLNGSFEELDVYFE